MPSFAWASEQRKLAAAGRDGDAAFAAGGAEAGPFTVEPVPAGGRALMRRLERARATALATA